MRFKWNIIRFSIFKIKNRFNRFPLTFSIHPIPIAFYKYFLLFSQNRNIKKDEFVFHLPFSYECVPFLYLYQLNAICAATQSLHLELTKATNETKITIISCNIIMPSLTFENMNGWIHICAHIQHILQRYTFNDQRRRYNSKFELFNVLAIVDYVGL